MKLTTLGSSAVLSVCLFLSQACSQSGVVEERVTYENGFARVCGVGEGLAPCRDASGRTYEEELAGPSIYLETDGELAAEATRIRNESPEELLETIRELELGVNPDDRARESLLDESCEVFEKRSVATRCLGHTSSF